MTLAKKIPTIAAVITMALAGTAFADTTRTFQAAINGSAEVPAVNSQTSGSMTLSTNNTSAGNWTGTQYTLNAVGSDITMAHLHCAPAGVNGPVVVTLFLGPQTGSSTAMTGIAASGILSSGTISDSDIKSADCLSKIGYNIANVSDLMRAITGGQIYANIHTVQFPDGAARGQLTENTPVTPAATTTTTATPVTSVSDAKTALLISLYQQLITVLTQWLVLLQQQKGITH